MKSISLELNRQELGLLKDQYRPFYTLLTVVMMWAASIGMIVCAFILAFFFGLASVWSAGVFMTFILALSIWFTFFGKNDILKFTRSTLSISKKLSRLRWR